MTAPRMFHPDDLSRLEAAYLVQRRERTRQLLDGPAGRETLAALLAHPGAPLSVIEIADQTAFSNDRVRKACDRAEFLGYVTVTRPAGDRFRRYALTDDGIACAREFAARAMP